MNNSKSVMVAGLAGLSVNATVGMDDVISVFITKYEDQQIADRGVLQKSIIDLNNQIKQLVDNVTASVLTEARSHEVDSDNGAFSVQIKVKDADSISLKWDSGVARINLETSIKSKSVTGYAGEQNGAVSVELALSENDIADYQALMADKSNLTDMLNQVQTNLRDVSRKERQVRGLLAQKKLTEAGMGDLLNDTNLLALVDESVLKG